MTRTMAALAATAAALIVAPTAVADPVTGGKTLLKPDVDTFEGFADMSTSVGATGAAEDTTKGVVFPISGGDLDDDLSGTVEHRGGLVFSQNFAGGEVLKFSKFFVKLNGGNKAKVFAKSGDSEIRFLDLDLSAAAIDPGAAIQVNSKATLAKPAAELMSDVFDFPFRKGIPIGKVRIKAERSG
jgi:hypothetical protein